MNVQQRFIIIGGVEIVLHSSETLSQSLNPISEGKHLFRTMGGNLNKQTHWQALETVISGTGSIPPGLNAIDFTQPYQIHCIKSRSVRSQTPNHNAIRTPRSDIPPIVLAHTGNVTVVVPSVTLDSSITASPVIGVDYYTINYYPIIKVISDEPKELLDLNGDVTSWSITAQETANVG